MASAKGSLKGSQKLDESLGQTSSGKPAYNTGPSVEYDTDQEQQLPMMPQLPPDVLRAQQQQAAQPQFLNMASDNPAPTGMRAWAGFGCAIFALACLCVAFASPYWMQTYPNSMNAFRNMGLWEICMDNYMHHKDDSQTIYNGCWWVFDRAAKYYKLREWLLARKYISLTCYISFITPFDCPGKCVKPYNRSEKCVFTGKVRGQTRTHLFGKTRSSQVRLTWL